MFLGVLDIAAQMHKHSHRYGMREWGDREETHQLTSVQKFNSSFMFNVARAYNWFKILIRCTKTFSNSKQSNDLEFSRFPKMRIYDIHVVGVVRGVRGCDIDISATFFSSTTGDKTWTDWLEWTWPRSAGFQLGIWVKCCATSTRMCVLFIKGTCCIQ